MSSQEQSYPSAAHAANLNNEASVLINSGNYVRASQLLAQSISTIKTVMTNLSPSARSTNRVRSCHCVFSEVQAFDKIAVHPAKQMEDCFIFQQPIQVFTKNAESEINFAELVEVLSYSVVYNLALCYHLRAISSTPTINQDYLRQAAALYRHSQKLIVNHSIELDMLHTLALVNNLGHAHHLLRNEPTAQECFQHLLRAIMQLSQDSNLDGRASCPNLDGFMSNIMTLIGSSTCAPKA